MCRDCIQNPSPSSNGKPLLMSVVDACYRAGQQILRDRTKAERKTAGQYLTLPAVARHMARMLGVPRRGAVVVEPAIGSGVLAAAVIEHAVVRGFATQFRLVGYDTDAALLQAASDALDGAVDRAAKHGVDVTLDLRHEDFILDHIGTPAPTLFDDAPPPASETSDPARYDAVLANPPYFNPPCEVPGIT